MARLSDEEIRVELASRRYDNVLIRPQLEITEPPVREIRVKVVLADDAPKDLRSALSRPNRPALPNSASATPRSAP